MVAGGRMEVRPAAETMYWAVNEQVTFANVDACVDVVAVSSAAPEESFAGLVFWYRGVEDFYALEIDPVGHAAIWAMTKDGWRSPVDWGVSDLVVTGEGKVNRLRVVTKGGVATAYINGKLFREMKALAPPPAAQKVGIIAGSPRDSAAQFAFDNLKVTAPD
jgi:hypothetical protein